MEKIIIIEDEASIRNVLKNILTDENKNYIIGKKHKEFLRGFCSSGVFSLVVSVWHWLSDRGGSSGLRGKVTTVRGFHAR